MIQMHREKQIPKHVLVCAGLALLGCGIVASNALFSTIPLWFARSALILLAGLGSEVVLVSLIDHYTNSDS